MSWVTCWLVSGWLLCLPATDHHEARHNAAVPHEWYNLYAPPAGPPLIYRIVPDAPTAIVPRTYGD
jgi:hypothetical protein